MERRGAGELPEAGSLEYIIEKDISPDTIDQVYAIAVDYTRDVFSENYPDDMRIDMQFQRAVLIKDGPEVISCIIFTCLDGSAHITLMATKRSCAGKGYGKLLMRRFVEHVTELGLNSIELFTYSPASKPAYAPTVGFYQSVGFEIIKECKGLWEQGTVTLKMRKSW